MNVGSFLFGVAVGAMVYACFAPKSGSEMRADVADAANQGKRLVLDKVAQVTSAATDIADQAKDVIANQQHAVSSGIEVAKDIYERETQAENRGAGALA